MFTTVIRLAAPSRYHVQCDGGDHACWGHSARVAHMLHMQHAVGAVLARTGQHAATRRLRRHLQVSAPAQLRPAERHHGLQQTAELQRVRHLLSAVHRDPSAVRPVRLRPGRMQRHQRSGLPGAADKALGKVECGVEGGEDNSGGNGRGGENESGGGGAQPARGARGGYSVRDGEGVREVPRCHH